MDEPTSNLPPAGVPDGELVAEDLQAVRFSLGFRGYRMDEVDEVLDRASAELASRDAEIDRLRSLLGHQPLTAAGATHASGNGTARPSLEDVPEHHGRHLRTETPSAEAHSAQTPSPEDWASHESAANDSRPEEPLPDESAAHDSAASESAADESVARDSALAEVRPQDGRPAKQHPDQQHVDQHPDEHVDQRGRQEPH